MINPKKRDKEKIRDKEDSRQKARWLKSSQIITKCTLLGLGCSPVDGEFCPACMKLWVWSQHHRKLDLVVHACNASTWEDLEFKITPSYIRSSGLA